MPARHVALANSFQGQGTEGTPLAEFSRITEATAHRYFNGAAQNIGVLLGEASGDLVDLDLDCYEAVHMASSLLPPTDAVFGGASKRRSHWLYTSPIAKRIEYADPADGEMLLELRSTGGQTASQARRTKPARKSSGPKTETRLQQTTNNLLKPPVA